MGVKLGRAAVSVLLIASRNRFVDFGVGREVVAAADLHSFTEVHGHCSSELEPKHKYNRRKRKRGKMRGLLRMRRTRQSQMCESSYMFPTHCYCVTNFPLIS
ncbi:hypothetical protein MTR67_032287 [Solanum verrucosum]|uniref:Uncharacterized protein n=1 Tax=Solanum verrucosum TaxID=315347 RepID=A0AAF0U403_SOLVR|nr:hypothetical protein MTR67_032287 [Solanum verrucosum]